MSVEGKMEVGSTVTLICNAHAALTFCHFIHPTQKKVFEMNSGLIHNQYSYAGHSLTKGHCGIKISPINYTDIGLWTCNIGWEVFSIPKVISSKVLLALEKQGNKVIVVLY